MKALGSRFSFYAGFVVGTFTLYVFLRQVWFERTQSAQQPNGVNRLQDHQQQLEEERKIWKKERSALFNLKHPHHTGEDSHMADELYKKVRILCWVMTGPSNLEKKARHVKSTWSRHCNVVVFMSSVEDPDFPTVGLGTKEGRDQLYWKTIRAFHYAYEHHGHEADWFLKADDDTYVIVDNLRVQTAAQMCRCLSTMLMLYTCIYWSTTPITCVPLATDIVTSPLPHQATILSSLVPGMPQKDKKSWFLR